MTIDPKIYVAGHEGMVGSVIVRQLLDLRTAQDAIVCRTRFELDLTDQVVVRAFFEDEKPDQVYLAATKVDGKHANNAFPAELIYENLMIEANVIDAAFLNGAEKLIFLGSSCIYPNLASQPMCEEALLTGVLVPTNGPYAIAKIAGIKLCESYNRQYGDSHGVDYRSVMPTNLYGPGDNYHPENSHAIPALIRRFHEAKSKGKSTVTIWGTGTPKREFLFVNDMAHASVHVMNLNKTVYYANADPMLSQINVGFGEDISISALIAKVFGYKCELLFDSVRADGAPQKLLDSTRLSDLGWRARTNLKIGLSVACTEFLKTETSHVD